MRFSYNDALIRTQNITQSRKAHKVNLLYYHFLGVPGALARKYVPTFNANVILKNGFWKNGSKI